MHCFEMQHLEPFPHSALSLSLSLSLSIYLDNIIPGGQLDLGVNSD